MSSEKTEKATPKRKQDERKKGNVFQSQDVTIVFSLLATFFGFKMLAPSILNSIELSLTEFLGLAGSMKEVTMGGRPYFFSKRLHHLFDDRIPDAADLWAGCHHLYGSTDPRTVYNGIPVPKIQPTESLAGNQEDVFAPGCDRTAQSNG